MPFHRHPPTYAEATSIPLVNGEAPEYGEAVVPGSLRKGTVLRDPVTGASFELTQEWPLGSCPSG